jgi:cell division septum initiation protein DivIVA
MIEEIKQIIALLHKIGTYFDDIESRVEQVQTKNEELDERISDLETRFD